MRLLAIACLALSGCASIPSPTATATRVVTPAVIEAQALHDAELRMGELLIRGSSIRSLMERYGHDPAKLWAAIVLGDHQDEVDRLILYRRETGL